MVTCTAGAIAPDPFVIVLTAGLRLPTTAAAPRAAQPTAQFPAAPCLAAAKRVVVAAVPSAAFRVPVVQTVAAGAAAVAVPLPTAVAGTGNPVGIRQTAGGGVEIQFFLPPHLVPAAAAVAAPGGGGGGGVPRAPGAAAATVVVVVVVVAVVVRPPRHAVAVVVVQRVAQQRGVGVVATGKRNRKNRKNRKERKERKEGQGLGSWSFESLEVCRSV